MSSESVVYRAVPIQEEEPESANVYGLSNNTAAAAAVQTRQSQRPSIVARCLLISALALSMLLVLSAVHSSRQFGQYTRRDSLFHGEGGHDGHGWMHHHNHHPHPHGGGHYEHGGYHGKSHDSWNHDRHDQEDPHGHHHHGYHHHDHNSHSRDDEEQVQPQTHYYYADEIAQESLPQVLITAVDTFELEEEQMNVVRIAPIVEEDLALVNPLP